MQCLNSSPRTSPPRRRLLPLAVCCTLAWIVPLPATSQAAATESAFQCPPLAGFDLLLERSRVLVFGELHGTDQSPAMVGDVVCHVLASGHAVSLGVELPRDEQPLLDAFLAADTAEVVDRTRQALVNSPFWSYDQPDGRSSLAMLELFDRLRQWAQLDGNLQVVAFDIPFGSPRDEREEAMSIYLGDHIGAHPDDVHVVLTGNLHSRIAKGSFFPLAGQIQQRIPHLISLDVAHDGGTAWVCLRGAAGCQLQKVGPRQPQGDRGIYLLDTPDRFGHVGVYHVGPLTGSKPAAGS